MTPCILSSAEMSMTVLNLSFAEIIDPELFEDYVERAGALMKDRGIEVVSRGRYVTSLAGHDLQPAVGAVFRYPDMATATSFFASKEYLALMPLRDKACRMTIHLFDEDTGTAHSDE